MHAVVMSLLVLGSAPASMTTPPRVVTLPEALRLAAQNQPDVAIARARLDAVAAERNVAFARWAPSLGMLAEFVGASTNNSTATIISNSAVDIPRVGATATSPPVDWTPRMTTLVALGLRQQVWDFGRTSALTAAAVYATEIERNRLKATQLDLRFSVSQAFYAVLAAQAVLKAATASHERAKVLADFIEASVRLRLRAPVDRARSQADLSRAEANELRAESGLKLARSVLAITIGLDDAEVDASPSDLPASLPVQAYASITSNEHDPMLEIARLRLELRKEESYAVRAQLFPTLFLTGSISTRAGGAPTTAGAVPVGLGGIPNVPNYSFGLVLSWNALDFVAMNRFWATRQNESVAAAEQRAIELRQRGTFYQVQQEYLVSTKTLIAQQKAFAAARSNFEQSEERYKAGLTSLLERSDAENLLTDAEIQLAVGEFQLARARLALERASAEEP